MIGCEYCWDDEWPFEDMYLEETGMSEAERSVAGWALAVERLKDVLPHVELIMSTGKEITWPTAPGQYEIKLAAGEWMVNRCHADPFRVHLIEGPGLLKVTIHKEGGATTVFGFLKDEKEPSDAR